MKGKVIVGILGCILCCVSSGFVKAGLIELGDNLIFDNSRNQVWYNNTMDLAGTWSESIGLMAGLQTTTLIGGISFSLEWNVATLDEVRILDFSQQTTRSLFMPTYQATNQMSQVYFPGQSYDWWFDMGRVANEGWEGSHLRASYSVRDYGSSGTYVNIDEPTDYELTADSWDGYGLWAVAELTPIPEPSSFLMLVTGLCGFFYIIRGRKSFFSPYLVKSA